LLALLVPGVAAGAAVMAATTDTAINGTVAAASPTLADPAAATASPRVAMQAGFDGMRVMPGTPGYARTALGSVHYWSHGDGPAIVLLHGGPMFGVQFAKVMPRLARTGYRAIAIDLPGYGFSTLPDHPPTGAEYADAIAATLDHLGVQRAAFAGMLTGGVVTLAFASRHPARTTCVALQDTPLYSEAELAQQRVAPAPDTRIWADGRHVTERWQARRNARRLDEASPEALQWQLVGTLLMGDPGRWWPGAGAGDYVSRSFDAAGAVRSLRMPAMVLTLRDDPMQKHAERILALRPDFRRVALPVGHAMVPYDYPDPWAEAVIGFLKTNCPAQ
jgi:pimeloyl-ACP methyl ester carboxylesterase